MERPVPVRRRAGGQAVPAHDLGFGHLAGYTQLSVDFTAGADADLEVFIGGWSVSGQDFWIQVDDVVLG